MKSWFAKLPLRQRLIVWYLGVLAVVLVSFSSVLYVFLQNSLYSGADATLRAAAVNIARLHAPGTPGLFAAGPSRELVERLLGVRYLNKYTQVVDISGRRAPEWLGEHREDFPLTQRALGNAAQGKMTFETFRDLGPNPVRVLTMPVIVAGRMSGTLVQVGASLESVEEALHRLTVTVLLILPLCLFVASLGGWILANKALKPVDQITRTARQITAQNLKERIEGPGTDDEIGRLAEILNGMFERLDHSFAQIRDFTADASHELKTPLTILKGEIELALRRPRGVSEYQEILASSLEEIERLVRITSDLLHLSKVDAGVLKLERGPVNLSALAEEAALHFQALAAGRGVLLEALPGASDVTVEGDAFRLKQLALNLVENAVHYTPEGGRVAVRAGRAGPAHAVLEVSDTGMGIAPEDQPRIFERFYRTDKARNRREGGTGLGLAIVKTIADAHGARIDVDSALQRGSTFSVLLPLRHGETREAPPPRPAESHAALLH